MRPLLRIPFLLALAGATAALVSSTASASTATPLTWSTPCSADLTTAACERLEWIANKLDDPPAAAGPISGTVALDSASSDRLDLVWWGAWAAVGLALVALIAPAWRRVFTWGTSGGSI